MTLLFIFNPLKLKQKIQIKNSLIYIHVNLNSQIKKKKQLSFLWVNSLINNDDGDDSYHNNHDNIINRIITADCKKCHRSCVFAAACTVSLSLFLGFALREVISVRLGILPQTLELRMGGATCRNTPAALHCLSDTSQGIRVGVQMKKRPADSLPPHPSPISPHPSFISQKEGRRGEGES